MENIKGLEEFLKVDFDYDYSAGSGSGCGYSSGKGFVFGHGYGSGHSSGYGYGDGSGYGGGLGDGNGSSNGIGYGDGYGYGYGYGFDVDYAFSLSTFNNNTIHIIDCVPTVIKSIKGNVAKGFILNSDFTLDKCFVVKDGNLFAHGETLREAIQSLNEKKWESLDTDEVIAEFCKKFEKERAYKGSEFFEWHHYLTGSCLQGRESFVKNHDLSLNDDFTVDEFIELTENDYGGQIIKQLKEVWESEE